MYLAVDLPHIKYRFGEWVIKWNKKHAVKYGFLEIVQDLAQADAALVVYRGSDTLNIALPLDLYDSAGNSYSATISKATAYLVIKGDGGLKVLWSKVMLVATTEESEGSKPLIEKEIEKRMKARSKK